MSKDKIDIIKIGGSVITDKLSYKKINSDTLISISEVIAKWGQKCIIVHGAGEELEPLLVGHALLEGVGLQQGLYLVLPIRYMSLTFGEPVELSGKDAVSPGPSPGADSDDEDDFARYRGLCSNCEERRSCAFPKPEGGVWHCEEYR